MFSGLLALPLEIYDEIASLLNLEVLLCLRLACRKLNQQTFRHVFNPLQIDINNNDDRKQRAITEDEEFRSCVPGLLIYKDVLLEGQITSTGNGVKHLNADGWANLNELILFYSVFPESTGWILKLVLGAPLLQKLKITDDKSRAVDAFLESLSSAKVCPRLRELLLADMKLSEKHLSNLLTRVKGSLHAFWLKDTQLCGNTERGVWVSALRKWAGEFSSLRQFSIAPFHEDWWGLIGLRSQHDSQEYLTGGVE